MGYERVCRLGTKGNRLLLGKLVLMILDKGLRPAAVALSAVRCYVPGFCLKNSSLHPGVTSTSPLRGLLVPMTWEDLRTPAYCVRSQPPQEMYAFPLFHRKNEGRNICF